MKRKNKVTKEMIIRTYDIVLVLSLVYSVFFLIPLYKAGIIYFIFDLLGLIFVGLTLFLEKKEHKYTSIIGVITGLFLFFTGTVFGLMLGILLIFNSIRLEKYIN